MFKKGTQQGRSDFDARSVLPVREHGKMARTPLVDFSNISLFTHNLHDEFSGSGAGVEINQDNLLPGA